MRTSRRLWLAVIGAALCLFVGGKSASACTCRVPPPPQIALQKTDAVFSGTVVTTLGGRVVFRVDRAYKGALGSVVSVSEPLAGSSCGHGFAAGQRWLVYGTTVAACDRTAKFPSAQNDVNSLGAGWVPSPAPLWGAGVALAGVISALAVFWIGKRRSAQRP